MEAPERKDYHLPPSTNRICIGKASHAEVLFPPLACMTRALFLEPSSGSSVPLVMMADAS